MSVCLYPDRRRWHGSRNGSVLNRRSIIRILRQVTNWPSVSVRKGSERRSPWQGTGTPKRYEHVKVLLRQDGKTDLCKNSVRPRGNSLGRTPLGGDRRGSHEWPIRGGDMCGTDSDFQVVTMTDNQVRRSDLPDLRGYSTDTSDVRMVRERSWVVHGTRNVLVSADLVSFIVN